MGYWKERQMEEEARGYRSLGDRYVCSSCTQEPALVAFVRSAADSKRCDFCGVENATDPIATHIDDVLALIVESLRSEYEDPIEELPYVSADGGYQGVVIDTAEVLMAEDCDFAPALHDEVVAAFGDRIWCRRDYFGLREDEKLLAGWRTFSDQVVHDSRYFFLSAFEGATLESEGEVPGAAKMLSEIGKMLTEAELVRQYPAEIGWFRARAHSPGDIPIGASGLGPPPSETAAANRMSPAGIPMFYGAADKETAVAEVMAVPANARFSLATIGTFVSSRPLLLINLTALPPVPSLFDADQRHLRASARFLQAFVDDLSKPVSLDGLEHLEYVPTQVVTEWLRRGFITEDGRHADGVVYPSARMDHGICCVLFVDGDACCDASSGWEATSSRLLALTGTETRVIHQGFEEFLVSDDLLALRQVGMRALRRDSIFQPEEYSEFAWRGTQTPEYLEFSAECRAVGARYGLAGWVVGRAALQADYHPELEPYPIEVSWPKPTVVAFAVNDPLFLKWLHYMTWQLNLRMVIRYRGGGEVVPIQIPCPEQPQETLTGSQRPPLSEAFQWRLEVPAWYPPAAASAVAWEAQHVVEELRRRLGYEVPER